MASLDKDRLVTPGAQRGATEIEAPGFGDPPVKASAARVRTRDRLPATSGNHSR